MQKDCTFKVKIQQIFRICYFLYAIAEYLFFFIRLFFVFSDSRAIFIVTPAHILSNFNKIVRDDIIPWFTTSESFSLTANFFFIQQTPLACVAYFRAYFQLQIDILNVADNFANLNIYIYFFFYAKIAFRKIFSSSSLYGNILVSFI